MSELIQRVHARRVWDSRGRPTVEVEITTDAGTRSRAIAPAGASRGSGEATDLRDGGDRLGGLDVQHALRNVNEMIAREIEGLPVDDQENLDARLDRLDPSPTRSRLGGNATVATSLAALHTAAAAAGEPLWRYLNQSPEALPRPEVQIIGGGAHAAQRVDIQDFMVVPVSADTMDEALEQVAEVYIRVGQILARRGPRLGVADEGGYWPDVRNVEDALDIIVAGIEAASLAPGRDIAISLDIAASEFEAGGRYRLAAEQAEYDGEEWIDRVANWVRDYPIIAVEDPAGESDAAGMRAATRRLGSTALIVGDDYLVTDPTRIAKAAAAGICNTALIKVNQAGTVSRAHAAHGAAKAAGWSTIVSARSGETEDVSVAHLAVGWNADVIKVGSITRGERTAKWNELLRIGDAIGDATPLRSIATSGHRS